ncbi:MAG: hypothetical protein K6G79_00780 [Bacteroidales bacterium]|nr:hypothetical protein [Bacteroidales bacterium]
MKPGDKLLVIHVDDSDGRSSAASDLSGVEATIESIDDEGRIFLTGHSEPLIPGRDVFTVTDIA